MWHGGMNLRHRNVARRGDLETYSLCRNLHLSPNLVAWTAAAIPAVNKVSGVVVVIATDDTAVVVVVLDLSQCLVSLGAAEVAQ